MADPTAEGYLPDTEFNPFPGLRPYAPEEHYLYFGRAEQTNELMTRLRGTRFLSVVGTSGSGKSSLVLAGLVPALHTGIMASAGSCWRVAIMRPGGDPIGNLAAALASPEVIGESGDDEEIARSMIDAALRGSSCGLAQSVQVATIPERDNVLLVVDQFEELFRFTKTTRSGADRDAAMAFVKLLIEAVKRPGRLYVVITMRSDFIGDCMEFPRLPEAINEGQYLVPRLTRDQLRQVITGPVGVAGGAVSPRLVSRLLNEVGDQFDQLPVLQHALLRMWDCWDINGRQGKIDLEHYRTIGTMRDALSIHAENPFNELKEGRERELAERVFRTLTETEVRGRGVRRPARVSELCEIALATEDEIAAVIEPFRQPGRCFLMPPASTPLTSDSIIDISHESLMRNWKRLVEWTKEEAASARVYRRLSDAAAHYAAGDGGLWRDPEVELALQWRERNKPSAAWARRHDDHFDRAVAFLEESNTAQENERRELDQRLRNRRRRKRRIAVSLVGATLMAGFSWYVWQEARFLGAVTHALTVEDPVVRAQILGAMPEPLVRRLGGIMRSNEPSPGGIAFDALRNATLDPIPLVKFDDTVSAGAEVERRGFTLALSADGTRLVTAAQDGIVRVWNADGRGVPMVLAQDAGDVKSVAFRAKDGDEIVTYSIVGEVGSFRFWDARAETTTPRLLRLQERPAGPDRRAAFSPDGTRLITFGRPDGTARIWNVDGGDELLVLRGHTRMVLEASFTPDLEWVVTASADKTARLWRVGDGSTAREFRMDNAVVAAAYHPGEKSFVSVDAGGIAKQWNEKAETVATLGSSATQVRSIGFTHDGKTITTTFDGDARLWSRSGESLQVFRGHSLPVIRAVASGAEARRNQVVATAGSDGTVLVWPLEAREPRRIPIREERIASLALATPGADDTLRLAIASGSAAWIYRLRPSSPSMIEDAEFLEGHTSPAAIAWFADGRIVTAAEDGSVRIRDDGESTLVGKHPGGVQAVAVTPDGTGIVTAGTLDKTARVWKAEGASGRWSEDRALPHDDVVEDASFDLDGIRIVTASGPNAFVWGPHPETPPVRLEGHRGIVFAATIGPKGRIATAASDNTAAVWTERRGEWSSIVLRGHEGPVLDASFSGGGEAIITASSDGTARVWAVGDGKMLYKLPHPSGADVESAVLSGDGAHGVTAHADGSLLLWRLTARRLRDYLRTANSTCLAADERRRNLGEFSWVAESRFEDCERAAGRAPTTK